MIKTTPSKIEAGIPIPLRLPPNCRYPFASLRHGDSFFEVKGVMSRVGAAAAQYAKKHPAFKFKCRSLKEDGVKGVRVWRVEVKK